MISSKKHIFISTGEVSGDLQGALLVDALKNRAKLLDIEIEITAMGGPRMAEAGATILRDTSIIGSIGLWESLPYLWPAWQIKQQSQQYVASHTPDVVVLIDYMGLNLSIGAYLKKNFPLIPILYYIAPQEWVWSFGQRRSSQIVDIADRILSIFPEEARYYEKRGATVTLVGHPLIDRMESAPSRTTARQTLGLKPEDLAIALLPASRQQELKYLLPVMFESAKKMQDQITINQEKPLFWIPLSLEIYREPITRAIEDYGLNATIYPESSKPDPLTVLAAADLAITKSGTVNLEIALLNVPQVVIYRVHPLTAWIAEYIVKFSIPFMSPPNLVKMQLIVPELLQNQATVDNITREAMDLLFNLERREKVLLDYQEMRQALGSPGVCDRVAELVLSS